MASLIKKKKANTIYYYVVESARVDGKPRIVHQTYLGTAESVARLAQDRSAPIPLSATTVDFGLPGALRSVHVSMASPVSSIRPIWERPKVSPGWPRIAVHRSRCRPQRSTSGCPARY